tara:strand:+ start:501 stop:707 length:207 start_codon:yes stop_codon:yes gene_type:complete
MKIPFCWWLLQKLAFRVLAHDQIVDGGFDYRLLGDTTEDDSCFIPACHQRRHHHPCQSWRSETDCAFH